MNAAQSFKTSELLFRLIVLSHWPHVAEQVQQHVAEHVSECERTRTQVAELVAQLVEQHVASVKAI